MASALPLTLKSISSTKLDELSKQRSLFNQRKTEILRAANETPSDSTGLRRKVQILLEGVTRLAGRPGDAFDHEDTITTASVSDELLRQWVSSLENDLKYLSVKYDHAAFYSSMVTEWLSSFEDRSNANNKAAADDDANSIKSAFEDVGRAEMYEQRNAWETLVFSPADVDTQSIETYLDRLFNRTKLSQQALKELRQQVKNFGSTMTSEAKNSFDIQLLRTVSQSLLASDLLSAEKIMILKEFLRNDEVAQEVADVLNLRFAAIDGWNWPTEGVPVEMRRQLNGKYRIFMDEDLIDAILFHYIGLQWSITLRRAFFAFLGSPAWKSNKKPIPKEHLERREKFLEKKNTTPLTIDDCRRRKYANDYFMSQLPASLDEGQRKYNCDDDDQGAKDRKSPIETKHSLLHLLITESIIHNQLRGQFTVIRSDFKWFGPSLPHGTLLTVLKFLGVPSDWLEFFKKHLECPLKFAQDGPEAAVRIRKRGIPICHTLSDAFGESVLFCMDYAVNQHADGAFLYRLHDDFWFWGEEETCRKAWRAMTDFTAVTGLEFNEEKTGTARLGRIAHAHGGHDQPQRHRAGESPDSDEDVEEEEEEEEEYSDDSDDDGTDNGFDPLPQGDIRWGFLRLDAERGRFLIDQNQVDAHIEELRHQLSACNSIFAWVQAWNSYFSRFFSNNFAKPSVAFGREHIDMAINTLSRIEREVFAHASSKASGNGGVVDHLRRVIAERFETLDLPDGFFYFPVEFGGLELHNPFINFLAMRENILQTPQRIIERVYLLEEANYQAAKKKWQDGEVSSYLSRYSKPEDFLSFEEYTAHLESTSSALCNAYASLLQVPDETSIGQSADLDSRHALADETKKSTHSNRTRPRRGGVGYSRTRSRTVLFRTGLR